MTPSMRSGIRIAPSRPWPSSRSRVPLAALAMARGDARASVQRRSELHAGRRPGHRREVRRAATASAASRRSLCGTARQISTSAGAIAGAVQARAHAAVAAGQALASVRRAGHEDARARRSARRSSRWARSGGQRRRPRAQARRAARPERSRRRERCSNLRMQASYKPSAPKGVTDDYRCFLLDPEARRTSFVTSARIEPGAAEDRPPRDPLPASPPARSPTRSGWTAATPGPGWSCFGGTGLSGGRRSAGIADSLNNANWIAAWAPGWGGNRLPDGTGVSLPAGSQIVMQVHYNLLNGRAPDRSRGAAHRRARARRSSTPLQTVLCSGPVELACAKGEQGKLCDRNEALVRPRQEVRRRAPRFAPAGLLILCRGSAANPAASAVSTCERRITTPTTIYVAAGHMHLLGAVDPARAQPGHPAREGAPRHPALGLPLAERATRSREPVEAEPGDVVRVTCRHDVRKRTHGRPRRASRRRATSSGARGRPTRCASGSCRSRAGSALAADPPRLARCTRARMTPDARGLRRQPRARARRARTTRSSARSSTRGAEDERATSRSSATPCASRTAASDPDVVYAHFLVPAGLAGARSRRARRSSSRRTARTSRTSDRSRASARATRHVVRARVVRHRSLALAARAARSWPCPDAAGRPTVVDCGVDLERFAPRDAEAGPRELGWSAQGTAFLCLGRLSRSARTSSASRAPSSSAAKARSPSSATARSAPRSRTGRASASSAASATTACPLDRRLRRRLPAEPRRALRPRDARGDGLGALGRRHERRRAARVRHAGVRASSSTRATTTRSARPSSRRPRFPRPNLAGPRARRRSRRQAAGGTGGGDPPASRSRSASLTSTSGRIASSRPASRATASASS